MNMRNIPATIARLPGTLARASTTARPALPFAAIVIAICALPFFMMTCAVDGPGRPPAELRVQVVDQGWEKAFQRFAPRKVYHVGLHVEEMAALSVEDRTFFTRGVLWAKSLFERSLNDRNELDPDELRILDQDELTVERRAVRAVPGSPPVTAPADAKPGDDEPPPPFLLYTSHELSGTIRTSFPLQDFPFDVQRLDVTVEPAASTAEDLVLAVDPASSLSPCPNLGEWQILGFEGRSSTRVARSDYSDPDLIGRGVLWNHVPRVTFTVVVKRRLLSHLIKDLFPLLIIMLMAYSCLFIAEDQFDARICMAVTSLLSVLALHWSSRSDLPGVAYLTAMDEFFLISYSLVLLVTVEAVITARLVPAEGEEPPPEPHPWIAFGIPCMRVLFPLLLGGGWLLVVWRAAGS